MSSVKGLAGVNSKCGVQSKRRYESHESCVCIVGFLTCGCQKKSVYGVRDGVYICSSSERYSTIYSTETHIGDLIRFFLVDRFIRFFLLVDRFFISQAVSPHE